MSVIRSFVIAFSMYSKVPMPRYEWSEKNARYVMCFFPFVGLLTGALCALAYYGMSLLSFPLVAKTLLFCVIPLIVTGGIHLDGFLDTSDALHSWREKEKKLEILKDPHIGAFAVIALLVYLSLFLSACSLLLDKTVPAFVTVSMPAVQAAVYIWCLSLTLSRVLSAFSVILFRNARASEENASGTILTFSSVADRQRVLVVLGIEFALCAAAMLLLHPALGTLTVCAMLLVFFVYRIRSYKHFGGITGDLAGWFLCLAELLSLLAAAAYLLVCS